MQCSVCLSGRLPRISLRQPPVRARTQLREKTSGTNIGGRARVASEHESCRHLSDFDRSELVHAAIKRQFKCPMLREKTSGTNTTLS